MFRKIGGFIILAGLSVIYVFLVVLPLRFIIGPLFVNVNALSPWQFIIGNAVVMPFMVLSFGFCYWGISKALLMAGSLKPTTHKRLFVLVLTVAAFCVFYYLLPSYHWNYDIGSMNGFHIRQIKR